MSSLSRLFSCSRIGPAIVLTILSAGVPTSYAGQILLNPGFESSIAAWVTQGGAAITNTVAHTGTHSVVALSLFSVAQGFASIDTSSISEVSFWVKSESGVSPAIRFFYLSSAYEEFGLNILPAGSDWTFYDVTAYLQGHAGLVGYEVFGATSGSAYFDDFTINANVIDEPLMLALFGTGLAGLGWRRRLFAQPRRSIPELSAET